MRVARGGQIMGRNHLRLGVWGLALLTCFAMLGQTAFAWDNRPRVEAAGFYPKPDFSVGPPNFADEIKIGVNGRCTKDSPLPTLCTSQLTEGRFEFFNKFTGFKIKGTITSLDFHLENACTAFNSPNGKPAVTIKGSCDDGAMCTQFQMDLVDNDPGGPDWVCNVNI